MKPSIFIDGREGTTGLQIEERLRGRTDIEQIIIPEALRKDTEARRERLNAADLVFLCLPDVAAREAVGLIENPNTRVIDASTAHRTAPGWVYGFPELTSTRRSGIRDARRVANPGCHATGFLAIVAPLVSAGVLPKDTVVPCHSLTGYSGGGKAMIAQYEAADRPLALDAPRIYGLGLQHKHLPEMVAEAGLLVPPLFTPIVSDYYAGMAVSVLLHGGQLAGGTSSAEIREILAGHYGGETFVTVPPFGGEDTLASPGFIEANAFVGTNQLELLVFGNGAQTLITARLDNLGKGASGAAVQNMNLMLGLSETAGL
ncbi:MAG: N-acetyl-gamma-glutamyl-phosphate reductase [Oscillospiraceae bacterium]|nr:N-acetyl-gamma-glutamyl-phosphate reductase [Oscillospiraceae bacterium]